MIGRSIVTILVSVMATGSGCSAWRREVAARRDSVEITRREAHLSHARAEPDSASNEGPLAKWVMVGDLTEISGLTITPDGRLLTHGDERAQISEIDYRRGVVVKRFTLGDPPVRGDFEGITAVRDGLVLLTSTGKLYQFAEGANGAKVEYTVVDTGLKAACEFEGVAFEAATSSLLLACKNVLTAGSLRDSLVIYRWKLEGGDTTRSSRLTVSLARLIGANPWKGLHPSDITIDPVTGNYLLVAGEESALLEITPAGAVVFARPLPPGIAHAEGVAVTRDGLLIVANEARTHSVAAITLFRRP